MKKSGFTLIEVICSIFVITIIFSSAALIGRYSRNMISDIKIKSEIYEIQSVFTYGKSYCRENKVNGNIVIDYYDNEVFFRRGNNILKKACIGSYGRIIEETTDAGRFEDRERKIKVSDQGKIVSGCTFYVIGENNNSKYKISIGVGIDSINIKKEDL